MIQARRLIFPFHDNVCFGEAPLRVALAHLDVLEEIAAIVDQGSVGSQSLLRGSHHRQRLVFHLDQLQRLLGDLLRLGGDQGDGVAHVAHLVVGQHRPIGDDDAMVLVARHVFSGQDGHHTGQGFGFAGVHPQEASVGILAAQHLNM